MSDYYSESDDDPKAFDVPLTFVSKSQRQTVPLDSSDSDAEAEGRRAESLRLAQEVLDAVPEAPTPADDIFHEPPAPDTNDTLSDPTNEYNLWVGREIDRVRAEILIEARYALDVARTARAKQMSDDQLREARSGDQPRPRGHMRYMQKYYHKGAYSVDEGNARAQEMLERDFTAPVGGDLIDKTLLPEWQRMKGDDQLKRGKSKWTNLRNEDTTTPESRNEDREFRPSEF
jgi:microfibrillar-associated protein 1